MKILRSKMTTRELADFTGMANQTINRWIREKKWKTERFPGVKGGRARLVVIDHEVKESLYGVPEVRKRLSLSLEEEPRADYTPQVHSQPFRQILDAVEKMSPVEQEKLALFLAREGIRNFLARLDIDESA